MGVQALAVVNEAAGMKYSVILFDLFRTLVDLSPDAPTMRVHDPCWPTAMLKLRASLPLAVSEAGYEAFLAAVVETTEEISRQRPPEYREVPAEQRFCRALLKVGFSRAQAESIAPDVVQCHQDAFVRESTFPEAHRELLHRLSHTHRIGLVSNYDFAPTVHAVLGRHRLTGDLHTIVTSAEFGRRKPHPAIFHEALRRLGAAPQKTLHVGDSLSADVRGAQQAGLAVAWFNPNGRTADDRAPAPTYVIKSLAEVETLAHLEQ